MSNTTVNNPLVVRCANCGGDLGFDIAKQRYCCAHCESEYATEEKKADYRHWKSLRQEKMKQEIADVKSFTCPSCGAQTLVAGDNVTAQCPFCQNTMIDGHFAGNDLPEAVIPFKLSKEEAEAKLKEWLNLNQDHPAAQVIRKNLQNLTGCYLPYHIVRGACNSWLEIRSNASACDYSFRSYLRHMAVNASNDLSNIFLDGIEPFDYDDAREFEFGYLNHHEAKVQNVSGEVLMQRIGEEIRTGLYKSLSKKVHTKEISVHLNESADGSDVPETIPALMPVYLVKCGEGIAAAVNGQTGKVSIDTGKTKNLTRFWWTAPTAASLGVALLGGIFGGWALALAGGSVFGIVFFALAFTRHKDNLVQDIITYPTTRGEQHRNAEREDVTAEFFADFGKGPVPVKIKFFTPWRIIKVVLIVLAVIFLPLLLAVPIQLLRGLPLSTIQVGYGAAWYCIPGFIAILAAGGMAKEVMYGCPLYYEIFPNGKCKRRRPASWQRVTLKEMLAATRQSGITAGQGCLIIGGVLFILLGSLLAMIS